MAPSNFFHAPKDEISCEDFRQRRTLEARAFIQKKGGELLSEYINNQSFLEVLCQEAHLFLVSWKNMVHRNVWCGICWSERRGRSRRIGEERFRTLVESYKGKFLGLIRGPYINKDESFARIECEQGHIFRASYGSVRSRHWCPDCQSSKGERACRAILARAFGKEFLKKKPHWLRKGKAGLELDGYCEELGVAFEFNGKQHYQKVRHDDEKDFRRRLKHDRQKRRLCVKQGVMLIVIPYDIPFEGLPSFLRTECERLGLLRKFPDARFTFKPSDLFENDGMKRFRQLVASKEARILSQVLDLGQRVLIECKNGHQWEPIPYYVLQGRWCGECAHNKRHTLEYIQQAITTRGIRCLSKTYENMQATMIWKCEKDGYEWLTSACSVIGGRTGCQKCYELKRGASQRLSLEDCHTLAAENNHRCRSKFYKNNRDPMKWECLKCGNVFERSYEKVASDRWCSVCRRTRIPVKRVLSGV